jgi:hypothetical protein
MTKAAPTKQSPTVTAKAVVMDLFVRRKTLGFSMAGNAGLVSDETKAYPPLVVDDIASSLGDVNGRW